jgi:hypothetical protein
MTKVHLIRKFAEMINGVDLSRARPGETLDVTRKEAALLVAEGWAEYATPRSVADAKPRRRKATVSVALTGARSRRQGTQRSDRR